MSMSQEPSKVVRYQELPLAGSGFIQWVISAPSGNRIAICDALGGWISELSIGGRSWLFRNTAMSYANRVDPEALGRTPWQTRYVDGADLGGGDFMLGGCTGEELAAPDGRQLQVVDHGFAWFQRPPNVRTQVASGANGSAQAVTRWHIDEPNVRVDFERRIHVPVGGPLRFEYVLTNRGRAAFPGYWSSHDMFPLDAGTELVIAEGTPMTVFHSAGGIGLKADGHHRWPLFERHDGTFADLSRPLAVQELYGDFACKVFSANDTSRLQLRQGGDLLDLGGDGRAGIWINVGGWIPTPLETSKPPVRYVNTCVERTNVSSDRTSDGLASGSARWLQAGEDLNWHVTYGT